MSPSAEEMQMSDTEALSMHAVAQYQHHCLIIPFVLKKQHLHTNRHNYN